MQMRIGLVTSFIGVLKRTLQILCNLFHAFMLKIKTVNYYSGRVERLFLFILGVNMEENRSTVTNEKLYSNNAKTENIYWPLAG